MAVTQSLSAAAPHGSNGEQRGGMRVVMAKVAVEVVRAGAGGSGRAIRRQRLDQADQTSQRAQAAMVPPAEWLRPPSCMQLTTASLGVLQHQLWSFTARLRALSS
mgnify:CR=1 FL=1